MSYMEDFGKSAESSFSENLNERSDVCLFEKYWTNEISFKGYVYRFKACPLFGLISPHEMNEISVLSYVNCFYFVKAVEKILENFQHEFWTDLLQIPKDGKYCQNSSNYFIIPLECGNIDWDIIYKGAKIKELDKFSEESSTSNQIILKTNFKTPLICKFICTINPSNPCKEIFSHILSKKNTNLFTLKHMYSGYSNIDALLDQRLNLSAFVKFRNLISNNSISQFNENSDIIIIEKLKPISKDRHSLTCEGNKNKDETFLIQHDLCSVFYLNKDHIIQAAVLLDLLMGLEVSNYLHRLSVKFNYNKNIEDLRESFLLDKEEHSLLNEKLLTVGETVLNLISTLNKFLNYIKPEDISIPDKASNVSKELLKEIAMDLGLDQVFAKVNQDLENFLPAFVKQENDENNTLEILNENLLADLVTSLIGNFFLAGGVLCAGEFIFQIGVIEKDEWEKIAVYLSNEKMSVLSERELNSFPFGCFTVSQLLKNSPVSSGESCFGYKFSNPYLLRQTLKSSAVLVNYMTEKYIILSRAIIKFIILTNLLEISEYDRDFYFFIINETTSFWLLEMLAVKCKLKNIEKNNDFLKEFLALEKSASYDADPLLRTFILNNDSLISKIIYKIFANILIDTHSLHFTSVVVGYLFCNIILYLVKNKTRYRSSISHTVKSLLAAYASSIALEESISGGLFIIKVKISGNCVLELSETSIKELRKKAYFGIYKMINSNEVLLDS